MNIEELFIPSMKVATELWQLGNYRIDEIQENAVVLVFCSEDRGIGGNARQRDFDEVRKNLFALSGADFDLKICDLGDIISGKTHQDTHYILQEIVGFCLEKKAFPIVIGGGNDLAYAMFKAVGKEQNNVNFTQISPKISLKNEGENITEQNFLAKILSDKSLKNYHHLAYQRHLNELDAVKLMKEVDFEVMKLADMMGRTDLAEPFLRRADLVTLNCDAVESITDDFSARSQVNGLNRREICAYMKEIGLGENLKSVGIFNYNFDTENRLNHQLLAQMIWYLLEGINIKKTHPKERQYETFIVMMERMECVFKREIFSGLWYFGKDEDVKKCLPCSEQDYENAKRGILNNRFK